MAQTVIRTSDLSGKPDAEQMVFHYEGKAYAIDLTSDEVKKFHDFFKPYMEKAVPLAGKAVKAAKEPKPARDYDLAALRAWASSNGIDVPAKGRIKQETIDAFKAAGN